MQLRKKFTHFDFRTLFTEHYSTLCSPACVFLGRETNLPHLSLLPKFDEDSPPQPHTLGGAQSHHQPHETERSCLKTGSYNKSNARVQRKENFLIPTTLQDQNSEKGQ